MSGSKKPTRRNTLNILVVGGGAREHTLVWKLAQSPQTDKLFVAPGNAGTTEIAQNLDISPEDIDALLQAAIDNNIGLTVVGPEMPLAAGIVDRFRAKGLAVFGPAKAAARIEASKVFSHELMEKYGIPAAKGKSFTSYPEAMEYLKKQPLPVVVKADGLAAGKGVVVAETTEQAAEALTRFMKEKTLGDAGNTIIIEECLQGREISYFAFCDGQNIAPLLPACDYKRVFDGGKGSNTGGMGSYCPASFITPELASQIEETIMKPTVNALTSEGAPYTGVLYAGLMITSEGPKVLEFNARFGDPETQTVLPLLKTDLVDIFQAVINGRLDQINIEWSTEACVGVVLASGGYPDKYQKGLPISGLDKLEEDVTVFHAGTRNQNGQAVTNGGRVLTVTTTAPTVNEARSKVYNNMPRIKLEGGHYRKDIALMKEGEPCL